MSSEEKTEEPTAHKLREARKRGEVAKGQDLVSAVGFGAVLLLIWAMGEALGRRVESLFSSAMDAIADASKMQSLAHQMLGDFLWIVGPIFVAVSVGAMLAAWIQTGGVFSTDPVMFRFDRMNPAASLQRLFSTRTLLDTLKMMIKTGALVTAVLVILSSQVEQLAHVVYLPAADGSLIAANALKWLFAAAAVIYLALGIVDLLHQRFEHLKANRMSKSERKREHKDQEGDPHMKSELRARSRELAQPGPLGGVKDASVVVTNPTHFAVALFYEPGVVPLPIVVAKGEDDAAHAMRAQAREHGVPVMEFPPLARSLYSGVPVGGAITDRDVEAVAIVFRWVRSLRHRQVAHG